MKLKRPAANSIIKWSWIVWGASAAICIFFLIGLLIFYPNAKLLFTEISGYLSFLWFGIFFIGCSAFALASFLTLWKNLPKNKLAKLLLMPVVTLVFPFYLIVKIIEPKILFSKIKQQKIKILKPTKAKFQILLKTLIVLFVILPLWLIVYIGTWFTVKENLGLTNAAIGIAGTGSMFPTFPKRDDLSREEQRNVTVATPGMIRYPNGIVINGFRILGHEISRGDIVAFDNEKTYEITIRDGAPAGFVKRVVAIEGDKVEVRGGIFYLNGQPQKEPYVARSQSTFGGDFLAECKVLEVPQGDVFVMGDNRKASDDSRMEVGFVKLTDINHVLPWSSQVGELKSGWHDPSNDLEDSAKIRIDKSKFVDLLNAERKKAKASPLKYQPKLEVSAGLRGTKILEFDDLSWEATRSGYQMWKAMRDAKYSNITYGEAPSLGLYDAEELIENRFSFPDSKKFLLNKDYQEIGIAETEIISNGCPKQITVIHVAGYVPPNYKQEVVDSWKHAADSLKEIQPSWEESKQWSNYASRKADIDRITQIISIRISRMNSIYTTMSANKWLSNEQTNWVKEDEALYKEQESLASKLNGN